MNFDNNLSQQADKLVIAFGSGRVDSVEFDQESTGACWDYAETAIDNISRIDLAEATARLGLPEDTTLNQTQEALRGQLTMFRFSFHAWLESYGEDKDPDEPLIWISDGKSFEDDFHRSAWILAGCGVVQAACLVCKGFDIPSSI